MDIDLAALRAIERDKEIPMDYLIKTLEDALLNTCLFVGGAGERDHRGPAGHAVADLDYVAERVDRRVARQEAFIHDDTPARVEFQPGVAR